MAPSFLHRPATPSPHDDCNYDALFKILHHSLLVKKAIGWRPLQIVHSSSGIKVWWETFLRHSLFQHIGIYVPSPSYACLVFDTYPPTPKLVNASLNLYSTQWIYLLSSLSLSVGLNLSYLSFLVKFTNVLHLPTPGLEFSRWTENNIALLSSVFRRKIII